MKIFQIVLIVGLVASVLVYLRYLRSTTRDRLLALIALSAAVLLVMLPDFTTLVANAVGIGRGADLVLYLFIVFVLLVIILLKRELQELRQSQTQIVRFITLENVKRATREQTTNSELRNDSKKDCDKPSL